MADQRIDQLTALDETTIASGDLIVVYDISAGTTKKITKAAYEKSIATVIDSTFEIANSADTTKKVKISASGVSSATTRTLTAPNASGTIVLHNNAQTLTNKVIDPALNTIDGDVLDITFNPTNYTPTITGATGASDIDDLTAHLKGIDDKFASAFTKQVWMPAASSTTAAAGTFAPYTTVQCNAAQVVRFNFHVPTDFITLASAQLVIIPTANSTLQYDLTSYFNTFTENYSAGTATLNNQTLSVTTSIINSIDASGVLSSIAANDIVGLQLSSDVANIYVLGLLIKYN